MKYIKYLLSICLAVGTSLHAFAADLPDDAKAVQGNWKPVKAELAGQDAPNPAMTIWLQFKNPAAGSVICGVNRIRDAIR